MNLCLIQNAQEDVDLETALTDEHRDTSDFSYENVQVRRINETE